MKNFKKSQINGGVPPLKLIFVQNQRDFPVESSQKKYQAKLATGNYKRISLISVIFNQSRLYFPINWF